MRTVNIGLILLVGVVGCKHTGSGAEGRNDPAKTALPDLFPVPADSNDFSVDPRVGIPISRTRLLVLLKNGAGQADLDSVLKVAGSGATLVGSAPEIEMVIIAIQDSPDHTAIRLARDVVAKLPAVVTAALDHLNIASTLPPLPKPEDELSGSGGKWDEWADVPTTNGLNWGQVWAKFPGAWNWNDAILRQDPNRAILVGVIDGFVDHLHPELVGLVIHDDVDSQSYVTALITDPGDLDSSDHGTHIAGIIAANFSNKQFINGVTPFARILAFDSQSTNRFLTHASDPIKLNRFRFSGSGELALETLHLAQAGARVINISLGEGGEDLSASQIDEIHVGIEQASPIYGQLSERLGRSTPPVFVVAAAGNDGVRREQAAFSNGFCFASILLHAANVYCVEAADHVSSYEVKRAPFSNLGGTVSAPGKRILSTRNAHSRLRGEEIFVFNSGTSQASPHVAGLIAHLLAFNPDLTIEQVRHAVVDQARQGDSDAAKGIDAFAAMLSLPTAKKVLLDVDDGTADGNNLQVSDDAKGNGTVDMTDFRRVRDGLLWVNGNRDFLRGPFFQTKMDLNSDGIIDDDTNHPELWPRYDFNGDGKLNEEDIAQMAKLASDVENEADNKVGWSDSDIPAGDLPRVLPKLTNSGDLDLDAENLFTAGAREIEVSAATSKDLGDPQAVASAAPYMVTMKPHAKKIYTLPAGSVSLSVKIVDGPSSLHVDPIRLSLRPGERRSVTLGDPPVSSDPSKATLHAREKQNLTVKVNVPAELLAKLKYKWSVSTSSQIYSPGTLEDQHNTPLSGTSIGDTTIQYVANDKPLLDIQIDTVAVEVFDTSVNPPQPIGRATSEISVKPDKCGALPTGLASNCATLEVLNAAAVDANLGVVNAIFKPTGQCSAIYRLELQYAGEYLDLDGKPFDRNNQDQFDENGYVKIPDDKQPHSVTMKIDPHGAAAQALPHCSEMSPTGNPDDPLSFAVGPWVVVYVTVINNLTRHTHALAQPFNVEF